MTLLAPAALAFAVLLAVPIAVHIFKPRRVRQTPFSSLRWLTLCPQKLSRRIRWHQLLLFAMRAAFLLLLVFSLARPLWSSGDAPPPGERVIVLDVSRSMGLRVPGKPSPIERARELAAALVESAPPGTRTTVLLSAETSRRLNPPDRDAASFLPELRRIDPTASDTNLASALALARPLVSRLDRPGEIVFVTDNQQGAWDADAFASFAKEMPAGVRVKVLDVGVGTMVNAWIASARVVETGDPLRRFLRVEISACGEPQDRTVRVSGVAGMPEAVRSVTVEPGRPTILHLELPAGDFRGQVARVAIDPPDVLPDDDEYFVCLDPRAALRVLLLAPDTGGPESTRPGFALRTAVESLAASGTRTARLTVRSPAAVTPTDVAAADVILLADVPELPASTTGAINDRVRAGAGLAVFLGSRVRQEWYNGAFYRPLQPIDGLLPLAVGPVQSVGDATWVLPARPHPLFAGLGDPLVGDLAAVSSRRYRRLEGTLPESASVAARLPDGTPALVEHRAGAGTVLVVNVSPDDSFSDLPRRKSFVPLVDHMLGALGKGRGREFIAGRSVLLPFDGARAGETVTVVGPGEERRTATVRGEGGRGGIELTLDRPGVYRVEGKGESLAFAVNVGRGDSPLSQTDPAALRSWWQPLECDIESAAEPKSDPLTRRPVPLWPVLVVLGAILLAAETLAAAWLCPRLTPATTPSLIQRQRLAAPGGEA